MATKKLTKKAFLQEVRDEIEHIKKEATPKEINNLVLSRFDPHMPSSCIYGLMTGRCSSDRALELTPKKYGDVGRAHDFYENIRGVETFTDLIEYGTFFDEALFTPLEVYITLKDAKWTNVIYYLKGEKSELKL